MKSIKNVITTQSTIQHTTKQISQSSSARIIQNNLIGFSPSIKNDHFRTSIFSNIISNNQKAYDYQYFCVQNRKIQNFQRMILRNKRIIEIFQKICLKKQRYSFQILKQFILFPDQSQSSLMSLSTYNPLIFHQQTIHSLITILQTQRLRTELWAFTNLKMIPKLKAAKQIFQQAQNLYIKKIRINKKASFDLIRQAADKVISMILPQTMKTKHCFWKQHSDIQTQQFQNIQKQDQINRLTSRVVDQQIRPVIRIRHDQDQERSDRIKVIKLSSNYYNQPQRRNRISIQHKDQQSYRVRSPIRYTEKPIQYVSKNYNQQKQQKKTNRYNVIHYYERPKQKENSAKFRCKTNTHSQCFVQQKLYNQIQSSHCYATHSNCTCCQLISNHCCCIMSQNNGFHYRNECKSKIPEKPIHMNQTTISLKQIQCVEKRNQQFYSSKMILPQLQSRIEYLKLLRSLADSQKS